MKRISFYLTLFTFVTGCDNHETANKASINDLSPFALQYLNMRSGGANKDMMAQSSMSFTGPGYQGLPSGPLSFANGRSKSDSTDTGSGSPVPQCGEYTEIDNADGSHTSIVDYGEGCTYGNDSTGITYWGKMTYNWRYDESLHGSVRSYAWSSSSDVDHLGYRSYYLSDTSTWETTGKSNYNGSYGYDSVKNTSSGWYNYKDNSTSVWNKTTYTYSAQGKFRYDESRSITEQNIYSYTEGDNYYRSEVVVPLIMDYGCNPFGPSLYGAAFCGYWFIYVSGNEVVSYRQDGVEGSFMVDYGDGSCDTKFTVTENGKTVVIDVAKDWPTVVALSAEKAGD